MSPAENPDAAVGSAARLLAHRVGLRLDPAIRGRLARAVADEAAAHTLDVPTFVARLDSDETLLQDLLNRVTVQETAFFRDPGQFDALAARILPTLPPPIRVWSAGCANGQEPASLAMLLAESGTPDWSVMATDISTRALGRARRARYSGREMTGVSDARRDTHFVRVGTEWELAAPLRQRVEIRHHNLVAEPPPFDQGGCDVVFCRNVLIYLRPDDVIAFLERLERWLAPTAWLFLGYSESLWQLTERFQLVRVDDAFVYRPRDDRAPAARTPLAAPARDRAVRSPTAPSAPPSPAAAARRRSTADTQAPPPRPRPVPAAAPEQGIVELLAAGEAAMNAGDFPTAIAAFRKCAYLDPDDPVAHFHLGLAMEGGGERAGARRAFAAARRALELRGTAAVEAMLEGYAVDELIRLLDAKIGAAS